MTYYKCSLSLLLHSFLRRYSNFWFTLTGTCDDDVDDNEEKEEEEEEEEEEKEKEEDKKKKKK